MLPSSWYGPWAGLKALVLGVGKSGFSVADTLVELGVQAHAMGAKISSEHKELLSVLGVEFLESEDPSDLHDSYDFAVVSPGFAPHHPIVRVLETRGVTLLSDVELAFRLRDKVKVQNWIAITGTNGKTTVTELTNHMLLAAGFRSIACGNIGNPILDAIRDPQGFDYLVVELSSFQLHYTNAISPYASAYLNLAEDHLDWHGSMDAYAKAKAKVFDATKYAIVYNAADPITLSAAEEADVVEGCRAIAFTTGIPARSMVGFVEDILADRAFTENRADSALEIATTSSFEQLGVLSKHLMANIAASCALARSAGVSTKDIAAALSSFRMAPHRIQPVALWNQIRFVDDSKATNAHAADASLSSFDSIVWIAGGLLKGVDPKPLIEKHHHRLRGVVLIGADTTHLRGLLSEICPEVAVRVVTEANVMKSAVEHAIELAHPGDVVLLAPAAASMDQFLDYSDRGNQFQDAVRGLS